MVGTLARLSGCLSQSTKSGANLAFAKPAHKRATHEGPLPFAVMGMLGLTRSPGQANADGRGYNFSLETPFFAEISGLAAIFPETAICEQHSLEVRDRMAD